MNTTQLKKFCGDLPGATSHLSKPPSNILVYSVGEKNFAWFKTSDPEKWRFSFRVSPERFIELTDMPGIKPARYMARFHVGNDCGCADDAGGVFEGVGAVGL